MLAWLIEISLRLRLLVVTTALAVVVMGVLSLGQSKMDVFPEFAPPKVEVQDRRVATRNGELSCADLGAR